MQLTASDPSTVHTLHVTVARSWVEIAIGTASGDGDITRDAFGMSRLRLQPGEHLLSFTPGVAGPYLEFSRAVEGKAAISAIYFADEGDLVLETPWTEEAMWSLRSAQSRSYRWLWHGSYAPRALVRYANDSWGLISWLVDDGPFVTGDPTVELSLSAVVGTDVVLSATRPIFDERHVGGLFQLTHAGQFQTRTVSGADQFTESVRVSGVSDENLKKSTSQQPSGLPFTFGMGTGLLGHVFRRGGSATVVAAATERTINIAATGTFVATIVLQRSVGEEGNWTDVPGKSWTAPFSESFDDGFDNAVVFYRLGVKSGAYTSGSPALALQYASGETTGVIRVTEFTDDQTLVGDVVAHFGDVSATRAWAEGAWSDFRGWPAAGDVFDGRLWLGSAISIWASMADNFAAFSVGELDTDGVSRLLTIGDASPIRWIKGSLRLLLGTDNDAADIDPVLVGEPGAVQVRSTALDEPLTPANMSARQQSLKVVFVDSSGARLRRMQYDIETGSMSTENLNRLNDEIGFLGGGFVDLAAQMRPLSRCWAPRVDGEVACLTLAEAESIVGWSRYVCAGYAESVSVTPGVRAADYDQDFAHMVVRRTVDGRVRRAHERIEREQWTDAADAWHVEGGSIYQGEAARYIVGLDHLLGESVLVWSEGAQLGPFEVDVLNADGEIGIDLGEGNETTKAIIGREMRTRYMSGKLAYGAQAGSAVGALKKASELVVLFKDTALECVRYGVGDAHLAAQARGASAIGDAVFDHATTSLWRVPDQVPDLELDSPYALFTGELVLPLDVGHMRDPRVLFEFDGAGPASVLGYVIRIATNEG